MRRATTPTLEINVDRDLTDCNYRVILAQRNGTKLIKDQNDCDLSEDGKVIYVTLTQEETLKFDSKLTLRIQIHIGMNGKAWATNIATLQVDDILNEEVI